MKWLIIDIILTVLIIGAFLYIKHYIERIPQGASCAELSYMGEYPIAGCQP